MTQADRTNADQHIETIHGDLFQIALEPRSRPEPSNNNDLDSPSSFDSNRRRVVLLHACNTVGSWGGGIAVTFKQLFPKQYEVYREHCLGRSPGDAGPTAKGNEKEQRSGQAEGKGRVRGGRGGAEGAGPDSIPDSTHRSSLLGTCLLISPPSDTSNNNNNGNEPKRDVYIGCLFTSRAYGRSKDSPEKILASTKRALVDLTRQMNEGTARTDDWELHACRFNSGKFGVPWEHTAVIVEELGIKMTVYVPPEET
ncbi:hypothetical protein D9757_007359 [Collybiopsis confluens]|uniref:ADP-ribose 1''-phosphate phosphatase n=1 Tax=Collybiopsis confluens TaxID=2823264 RepID=A0A8H5M7U6_9AGAR|nr:hypothetical protein D9757_007359 [Collybiopsis confluens]